MENYKEWLINKGFGINTTNDYNKFIEKKFKLYLLEKQIIIENMEHEDLMQYIRYRKSQGVQAKTINLELKKISYFLEFKGLPNIAEPIRLKGVQRRIPHDLFTEKQLNEIYNKFPESKNYWTHENILKTYH
ncbi:MAG: site-specific integrase [Bacteroidales bacterium]|nr:site-specific integrase [Bacteroidales bacterium]